MTAPESTHEPEDLGHDDCSVCDAARTRSTRLVAEGVTVSTEYSKLSVTFLPGGVLKIGQTKYADEFFLAIDNPDPTALYRMERTGDTTRITRVNQPEHPTNANV